jgi:small conductance mechanosensitive channel
MSQAQPLLGPPSQAALPPLDQLWSRFAPQIVDGALAVVGAVLVLISGLWLAGFVSRAIRRFAHQSPRLDDTLGAFFASLARWTIWAFTGVAVLSFFGIDTTSIVAVLGAATLAIGLALQGTLSNVAAGVMLIIFRPYKLGDFVEVAGKRGIVRDIRLFTTELDSLDNVRVFLPNGQCWGAAILNFSANDTRRVDLDFILPFTADINSARTAAMAVLNAHPKALQEPAPFCRVDRLNDYGVVFSVRVWTQTPDLVPLRHDLLESLPAAFGSAGIALAYPTSNSREFAMGAG